MANYQLSYFRIWYKFPVKGSGDDRIRTYEGITPADLQSAPVGRFGTSPQFVKEQASLQSALRFGLRSCKIKGFLH
jgi:hypothetical protein